MFEYHLWGWGGDCWGKREVARASTLPPLAPATPGGRATLNENINSASLWHHVHHANKHHVHHASTWWHLSGGMSGF